MNSVVYLFALFSIKHFVVDYLLQKKYQYSNKGDYGHPGGILHAGLHGVGTFLVLVSSDSVSLYIGALLSLMDLLLHYHIDWAKTNINTKMKWGPNTHEQYWWLLGLDQLLHNLTYVLIIYLII